jgi:tyrosine-protein kinase Etk/Wzc
MPQETVLNHPETSTPVATKMGVMDGGSEEQEIDVLEAMTLLLRGKKTILKFTLVSVALTAFVVYLVMKPTYTAEATFLPPQSAPGSAVSQLASQLGSLGAVGALTGGLKSPGDVYVGILKSRTIADDLIKRFDLQKVYKKKRISDTEKALKVRSTFSSGTKDTLITISVEDHDPKRAADLANGYLDSLYQQNGRLALTEAAQRRLFFEQQLVHEKDALADAEVELKKTEEQTGLISLTGQAQVEIDSIAQVRAQMSGKEIELGALKQAATDQNPEVVRLQTQIDGLEQQLQKLENGSEARQSGNVLPATAKVPALALEYVRKQREVKYREVLFELVAKQYESARLDESREAPVLQVVDRAVVPDKKSGIPRTLILLASCLLGALAGAAWIIAKDLLEKLQKDPARAAKYESLRQAAWPGRSSFDR